MQYLAQNHNLTNFDFAGAVPDIKEDSNTNNQNNGSDLMKEDSLNEQTDNRKEISD